MAIHYLEVVSDDVPATVTLFTRVHGVDFSTVPEFGPAEVATLGDGTLLGVRAPLADHESPIVRTYLAVENIQAAVEAAQEAGATLAFGPMPLGEQGTFAICILGALEQGYWQR
jgi:hypothetical protein